MNWNPNQFGAPPQQPAAPAPQYAPQGFPHHPPAPQGPPPGAAPFVPQGAPQGYAGPAQSAGYAAPPAMGFRPVAPTSLDNSTPDVPNGNHILVVKAGPETVGQNRDLLVVTFEVEQSDSVQKGTVGAWKRSLKLTKPGSSQMISNDIAKFVVPLSGRQKEQTDMQTAFNLVSEFLATASLDGKPIVGMRIGATVYDGKGINQKTGRPWPAFTFHTLG